MQIREQSVEVHVAFRGMLRNVNLTGFINVIFTFLPQDEVCFEKTRGKDAT